MEELREFFEKSKTLLKNMFAKILPQGKDAWFLLSLQCGFLCIFWLWITFVIHEPNQYWFISPGIFFIGLLAALLAGVIAASFLKTIQFIPFLMLTGIGASLVIAMYVTSAVATNWKMVLTINLWLVLPPILIGFGISYLKKQNHGKWIYKTLGGLFMTIGILGFLAGIIWIFIPGFSSVQPDLNVTDQRESIPSIQAENPAAAGPYQVISFTYGSSDKQRSEYGVDAAYVTESVDGSAFLPSLGKLPGWLYQQLWGFDKSELPLNGRVWMPDGDGPFPLVLIVHGNHTALDYSDEGYAYLGEILASRGMIFVSVDENFLNSSWINSISDDYAHQENDARGWLLLKHLEQFRSWSHDSDTVFYKKIDLNKIALIGHSRGGEAVTEAANFNTLGTYPDNGNITFPSPFNIRALIAIAPVDDQYNPASKDTPIKNIDYLVLQGSADADLKNFPGQAAYARVSFSDSDTFHFKSSFYLHQANHGQFNTSWGSADNGVLSYYLLDRNVLLDKVDQQQTALVLISAFLEASLNEHSEYLAFLTDPRYGTNWLPDVTLWSQYAASTDLPLVNFEEDINLHSGTFPNSTISAKHFESWRENILYGNRNRAIGNSVVILTWGDNGNQPPTYEVDFHHPLSLSNDQRLSFAAAVANNQVDKTLNNDPIQFSIEITDGQNNAHLTTGAYALLYENPQLSLMKTPYMNSISGSEPVLQTVQIPISVFQQINPDLDISAIQSIRFVFDQTQAGKLWLDDIAIR